MLPSCHSTDCLCPFPDQNVVAPLPARTKNVASNRWWNGFVLPPGAISITQASSCCWSARLTNAIF